MRRIFISTGIMFKLLNLQLYLIEATHTTSRKREFKSIMESSSPKPSFCNEKRQKTLNNLLLDSSSQGHIINVKKWIRAGAEIDTSDNGGDSPVGTLLPNWLKKSGPADKKLL